jgi:hypothetical protein
VTLLWVGALGGGLSVLLAGVYLLGGKRGGLL